MTRRLVVLSLPYPPSLNHYYRRVGPRTLISREGRAYRESILAAVAKASCPTLHPPLRISLDVWPPDRRRRDLDNVLKALLDALEHSGLYADDSQIESLHVMRRQMRPGGGVLATIEGEDDRGRDDG